MDTILYIFCRYIQFFSITMFAVELFSFHLQILNNLADRKTVLFFYFKNQKLLLYQDN